MPDSTDQITEVKDFRKQADALMAEAKRLADKYGGSRAFSLMFTHAELAKMYGGKRLEELGSEFPAELADKSDPVDKSMQDAGERVAQEQRDKLTPTQTSDPDA